MHVLCVSLSATIQRTLRFDSFSPDAVNRTRTWREDASGKAVNAARVLNQLSPGCALVLCPVGRANADHFMRLAENDAALCLHPVHVAGATRECWTLLDAERATTTEVIADESQDAADAADAEQALLAAVHDRMPHADALLLAGSRPPQWTEDLMPRLCALAADAGKIILADFRGAELLRTLAVCTPHIIKINEEEFCQTFLDGRTADEAALHDAIAAKSAELRNIVIVTRGKYDTLAAQHGAPFRCPAETVPAPVNTTACGDSFAAGFLHDYLRTRDMRSALQQGTHCAALNAQNIVPGAIRGTDTK